MLCVHLCFVIQCPKKGERVKRWKSGKVKGRGLAKHNYVSSVSVILSLSPLCKGRGVLHNHSKVYTKGELNNCKGETQHIPIKG